MTKLYNEKIEESKCRRERQAQILLVRVLNQIQIIKKSLAKGANFETYNDFMIIAQIVPKLPCDILVEILQQLRIIYDQLHNTLPSTSISINPLLDILNKVRDQVSDHLLNDFLTSSAYLQYRQVYPTV